MNNRLESVVADVRPGAASAHAVATAPPGREIRIGLLWHSSSSGNLGVGALTLANMAILRGVAGKLGLTPKFTIIGMRDGAISYVDASQADVFVVTGRSMLSPGGVWRVTGEQDCLIDIGAGDSFADIYGLKRFVFLWLTKMVAIARRRPLMLAPQTIGPFTRSPYKQMAKIALEGARVVVARDDVSLRVLGELAPRAKGVQSVDVAFALPFDDRSAERGGPKLRVGVNVSGLLFTEADKGINRFGLSINYAAVMRRFVEGLVQRGAEVHLVSHVVSNLADDDDGRISERLHAEFPQTIVVPTFAGPSQAKSYISSLDFLTAGRMHACIAAYSSGTPVAPVAYSRKFTGLFGMLGYPWLVPVTGFDDDQAVAYLNDCLDRRAELAADMARGMGEVSALLGAYETELADFMAQAVADAR